VTYAFHLQLVGKRVVDFLFTIIEFISLALKVEMVYADIGRNCRFLELVGHFERKCLGGNGRLHQPLLVSEN